MQMDLKTFIQEVRTQPLERQEEMISEFKNSKENIDGREFISEFLKFNLKNLTVNYLSSN